MFTIEPVEFHDCDSSPTVHTPSFRNCLFQNLTFLKHLKKNKTMSSFCNPLVLKSAEKIKMGSLIKKNMPKNYFE